MLLPTSVLLLAALAVALAAVTPPWEETAVLGPACPAPRYTGQSSVGRWVVGRETWL